MAIIRYVRSAATVSWIDPRTGLPEVDQTPPGASVSREFLTGSSGFRFVNFMEIWANFDVDRNTIVGHGMTQASGIYTSPSFAGIPSRRFQPIQLVRVGQEPITFRQTVGARTESPERIGGSIFGPGGNILASAVKAFPPIWTEIEIQLFNDGNTVASVLRHSLFPSATFYTRPVYASLEPQESGPYTRTPIGSATNYDGMPNYDRWYANGWGSPGSGSSGPVTGNPWNMERSVLSGIDHTQPFGW